MLTTAISSDQPDMRLHHTGIIVADFVRGAKVLTGVMGCRPTTAIIEDPGQRVAVQFFVDNLGNCFELIVPLAHDSPVSLLLFQKRNLLNHVAFKVPDFPQAVETLRIQGCMPVGPAAPATAFGGNQIQFFLTPLSIVLELIESREAS